MENDEQERRDPAGEPDDEDEVETDTTISYEPVAEERRERGREAAAAVTGLKGFALVVARGPRRGLHWLLAEGATEAGRSTKADIFLDDITVSRRHARFTVEGGRLWVEDLGSTNGTYVNRQRKARAELAAGDEVIVGRFHLVVARGDG